MIERGHCNQRIHQLNCPLAHREDTRIKSTFSVSPRPIVRCQLGKVTKHCLNYLYYRPRILVVNSNWLQFLLGDDGLHLADTDQVMVRVLHKAGYPRCCVVQANRRAAFVESFLLFVAKSTVAVVFHFANTFARKTMGAHERFGPSVLPLGVTWDTSRNGWLAI